MALRKFSRHMKVVTVIVILAFIFSAAYTGYSTLIGYLENRKEVMFTFDGQKVYKEDFEKTKGDLKNQLSRIVELDAFPEDFYTKVALSTVLEEVMANTLSKQLKVKVSKSEINDEVKRLETQYGGKENFNLLLAQNRTNLTNLKKDIKKEMLARNTINKLKEQIKPTDEKLQEIYEIHKYTELEGKTFEEAREQLESIYYSVKINMIYHTAIENIFLNAKIKTKNEEIQKVFEDLQKKEVEYEGMYITNKDLLNFHFINYLTNREKFSEKTVAEVKENQMKELKRLDNISKIAKEKGLKEIEGLTKYDQAKNLENEYFDYLVKEYNPDESLLLDYFNRNRAQYDTKNTVSGDIIGMTFKPTANDEKIAEEKANEIKKEATAENFGELATKYSKDTASAVNGGDLGMADIRQYVSEFSVLVKHNEGEIVGPIKTQFGYHIVYIAEKDKNDTNKMHLKHILIASEPSEETKALAEKEINELAMKLGTEEINVDDVVNNKDNKYDKYDINTTFSDVTINAGLPIVGYNAEIMNKLFASKLNSAIIQNIGQGIVLLQKTSEVPYKKATFEETKGRVRIELAIEEAKKEILK